MGRIISLLEERVNAIDEALRLNMQTIQSILDGGLVQPKEYPIDIVSRINGLSLRFEAQSAHARKVQTKIGTLRKLHDEIKMGMLLREGQDTVKLQYISHHYSKGSALLAIIFLPGIFVSVRG